MCQIVDNRAFRRGVGRAVGRVHSTDVRRASAFRNRYGHHAVSLVVGRAGADRDVRLPAVRLHDRAYVGRVDPPSGLRDSHGHVRARRGDGLQVKRSRVSPARAPPHRSLDAGHAARAPEWPIAFWDSRCSAADEIPAAISGVDCAASSRVSPSRGLSRHPRPRRSHSDTRRLWAESCGAGRTSAP